METQSKSFKDGQDVFDQHTKFLDNNSSEKVNSDKRNKICSCLWNNALIISSSVGVALGFGLGFGLRLHDPSADTIMWIGLPGEIFMKLLKLTIIPLIVSSIVSGTASSNPKQNGLMSILTFTYFILTNLVGSFLGIIVYLIFKPGSAISNNGYTTSAPRSNLQTQDMFADLIRNIVPDNLITACITKTQTSYKESDAEVVFNNTNITVHVLTRVVGTANGTNVIGLIFIACVVGMAASKVPHASTTFLPFFQTTVDIFMCIMKWFVWSTPLGAASLIAVSLIKVDNLEETFSSLGIYILAFLSGTLIQQVVFFPLIYAAIMRRKPTTFILSLPRTWITAFAPPSSAMCVPEMLNVSEHKLGVNASFGRFIIPLGATISHSGSGYFISLSILFIVGLSGIPANAVQILSVCLLTTVGTMAIPSIPSGSIVAIIIILSALSIDATNIGILIALEWLTDRLRTTTNTVYILLGAVTVDHLCSRKTGRKSNESVSEDSLNGKIQNI